MFKPRTRGKRISVYDALAGKNRCLKKSIDDYQVDKDLQNTLHEQTKKQKTENESKREHSTDDEIDRQFLYRMLTMNDD